MSLFLYKRSVILFFIFIFFISLFISPINGFPTEDYDINSEYIDTEGFILFAPERSTTTYLINYDGDVVYSWESSYNPGFSAYLLESGELLRTCYLGSHPIFYAGGMAGGVQEINSDGGIDWDYKYKDNTHLSHHDVEPLPNGNILIIAWEYISPTEAEKDGRDPAKIPYNGVWPDHIVEVKQTGATNGEIVWQWHAWDHLIQDFDSSKDNYGVISQHPELIDINYGVSEADWLHSNSIDYNEELDQIILCVRNFNEFWVIDHSTTTQEAAGHTGGNCGKGGDLLYRWGNPQAYQRGDEDDQEFFGQHDANWIDSGCPGVGNILVFNNGIGRPGTDYSSVEEINPPVDENGNYYIEPSEAYGPEGPTWTYEADNIYDFYSASRSGSQRLTDGQTLICNAEEGYFFEVKSDGEIIWDFLNPYPNLANNIVFKIHKYSTSYPGIQELLQPPDIPSKPNGPTFGIIETEYTYTTFTTDPNEKEIYYLFDWNDGTDSEWIGPYESGEICTANHIWYDNGSYEITVKAKNIYDMESEWSNPLNVIIGNIPPEAPIITGPNNGKMNIEYDYTFKAIDPNNDNIKYIIDWGDENFYTSDYYPSGTEITLSHSWGNTGKFKIIAKAEDSNGLIGPENSFSITILKDRGINTPFLKFIENHPFIYQLLQKLLYNI